MCLFIQLTLKTNSSYPTAYLLNLLFIYGVILVHIRAHLHSERKKTTFASSKLRIWTLNLLSLTGAQHSAQK